MSGACEDCGHDECQCGVHEPKCEYSDSNGKACGMPKSSWVHRPDRFSAYGVDHPFQSEAVASEATPRSEGTVKPLDGKFGIDANRRVVNLVSGEAIPEDEPLFLLRGRDGFALAGINGYQEACKGACNEFHLAGIQQVREKFCRFSAEHPKRMKQPGITRHLKLEDRERAYETKCTENCVQKGYQDPNCPKHGQVASEAKPPIRSWNGKELRHLTRNCADGDHAHCGGIAKFVNADNTDDCRQCNCSCHGASEAKPQRNTNMPSLREDRITPMEDEVAAQRGKGRS